MERTNTKKGLYADENAVDSQADNQLVNLSHIDHLSQYQLSQQDGNATVLERVDELPSDQSIVIDEKEKSNAGDLDGDNDAMEEDK